MDKSIFTEIDGGFTIFVVERRFAVGQGLEYFKSFKNKPNYFCNERAVKKNISKIMYWTQKNIPHIASLIKDCFFSQNPDLVEIVTGLSKLFTVNQHQAVGPEVLDPIIIEEGDISDRLLTQLISLYKSSILRPNIIILLVDNDFDRAKHMLSKCPHGMNVKMIRNSGEIINYKIINCGANDVAHFIDAFSLQCFSTCSKTKKEILLNDDWAKESVINTYVPQILRIRANLLFDEKDCVRNDINLLLNECVSSLNISKNIVITKNIEAMLRLFKVYCNDYAGKDLIEAEKIAKELDNNILLAHVYRYNNLTFGKSFAVKQEQLLFSEQIFRKNNIEDHSIYCRNNRLVNTFYTENISIREFEKMQIEAVNNVPGLVGMSIIYNNLGVAYLYNGYYAEAVECFSKGLNYSRDRIVQDLGIRTNILIAKTCNYDQVEEKDIRILLDKIFTRMGLNWLPFISASYIINIISITLKKHPHLFRQLNYEYPLIKVIQNGLSSSKLGSGSMCQIIELLKNKHSEFREIDIIYPTDKSSLSGIRLNFIISHALNPMIFNAWL